MISFMHTLLDSKKALAFIVALVLMWVTELTIILSFISSHIPFTPPVLLKDILFHYRGGFAPERELLLYASAVIIGVILFILLAWVVGKNIHRPSIISHLRRLSHVEFILSLVMVVSALTTIIKPSLGWVHGIFYVSMASAFGIKVFWPEISRWVPDIHFPSIKLPSLRFSAFMKPITWIEQWKWFDGVAIAIILMIIVIPDPEAVIAQLFMGDYFHTWDVVFMGSVYGLFKGLTPLMDMNATYGLGMVTLMYHLMQMLGGFDYVNALKVLMALGIVYYALWYLLLRRLMNNKILCLACIVMAMRLQMFIDIVIPMTWNEVQSSILRFCYDVIFFWFLYMYGKTEHRRWWLGLVCVTGLSMYHMPSTGIFLFITFLTLWGIDFLRSIVKARHIPWDNIRYLFLGAIGVMTVFFFLMYKTVDSAMLQPLFWNNLYEWTSYFSQGIFYGPLLSAFKGGEYVLTAGAIFYPLFYLGVVLYAGFQYVERGRATDRFFVLLSVYGLGLFTYYVGMSHKYLTVGLPLIFTVFWCVDCGLKKLEITWQKIIPLSILVVCVVSLWNAQLFKAYPNVVNRSANPVIDPKASIKINDKVRYFHQLSVDFPSWLKLPLNSVGETDEAFKYEDSFINHAALKSYYQTETAFSEDAGLIRSLTGPQDRVALLSSFEVMLLSKADRKPFFYYFPLLNSHPMRMRNFVVTTIFSYTQVNRCIQQLVDQKPAYIFMEKIFLTDTLPAWYGQQFEDLIGLIRYIKSAYEPYEQGKYLVAMKLKGS